MSDYDVDVEHLTEALNDVRQLTALLEDPRPLYQAIADKARQIEQERFDREGPGWDALTDKTIARKREYAAEHGGVDMRPLRRTLNRRRSLLGSIVDKANSWHVERVTQTALRFGTKLGIAPRLQADRPFLTYVHREDRLLADAAEERLFRP